MSRKTSVVAVLVLVVGPFVLAQPETAAVAGRHLRRHLPVGALPKEGVTGMPLDVTPLLSLAGIWQPIADEHLDAGHPDDAGGIANTFAGNITLSNGREGMAVAGRFHSGSCPAAVTPANLAILEQQPDGTLRVATSTYVADPEINGAGHVVVADFNQDGIDDLFLPAFNECPHQATSSSAYLSNPAGTFSKTPVPDLVNGHGAALATIDGIPTAFTANYHGSDTATQLGPEGFSVVDLGPGGHASIAVSDFYGDETYSMVLGDFWSGPGFQFVLGGPDYLGFMLWHLDGWYVTGSPLRIGTPYFNGKPRYAQYPSMDDPYVKTHSYRTWVDDFNHDGMIDILVQGMIWSGGPPSKSILQMFRNKGGYEFEDVTDRLDPEYDEDCTNGEFVAQVRDVDASGVDSYLFGSSARFTEPVKTSANYVIVNDGSGRLHVALHETLNSYQPQICRWLAANPTLAAAGFDFGDCVPGHYARPAIRAYRTPDGRLNFVALYSAGLMVGTPPTLSAQVYVFVNVPLRLDLATQYTQPIVVGHRNGSHRIRTFAGDDVIYSGNSGGYAHVDGGLGTNTAVYSGPARNYTVTENGDGSWTVKDTVGSDGTDTLVRIQRLQFADAVRILPAAAAGTGGAQGSSPSSR